MKYLPDTDRDKYGDLRAKLAVPYVFAGALLSNLADAILDNLPFWWALLIIFAAAMTVGAGVDWLTRRTPTEGPR